ncbi:hypothetical protein D3C73_1444540 [compost metagenome]
MATWHLGQFRVDQLFMERQPGVGQRVLESLEPGVRCRYVIGVVDHSDPRVTGVDQGLNREACTAGFVGDDR